MQTCALLSTGAAISGGSFLPVPHKSRNFPGASQGKTGLAAFLGEGYFCLLPRKWRPGRPPPCRSVLHQCCRLVWRALLHHGASWSPYPKPGNSYPRIWGSGLPSCIKLQLGLGVVPPSTARMPRPLGAPLRCPDGSVLSLFHPLCYFLVLMGDTLGTAKKDSSSSTSWKEHGLHSSPHCRILEWP